jgi:hypothetical protein
MKKTTPGMLKIILVSIFNGIVAMTAIFFVTVPVIGFILFLIDGELSTTTDTLMDTLDVIIVIFCIGTVLEIIDRIIRGIKKSKILTIIRDKTDRW